MAKMKYPFRFRCSSPQAKFNDQHCVWDCDKCPYSEVIISYALMEKILDHIGYNPFDDIDQDVEWMDMEKRYGKT